MKNLSEKRLIAVSLIAMYWFDEENVLASSEQQRRYEAIIEHWHTHEVDYIFSCSDNEYVTTDPIEALRLIANGCDLIEVGAGTQSMWEEMYGVEL